MGLSHTPGLGCPVVHLKPSDLRDLLYTCATCVPKAQAAQHTTPFSHVSFMASSTAHHSVTCSSWQVAQHSTPFSHGSFMASSTAPHPVQSRVLHGKQHITPFIHVFFMASSTAQHPIQSRVLHGTLCRTQKGKIVLQSGVPGTRVVRMRGNVRQSVWLYVTCVGSAKCDTTFSRIAASAVMVVEAVLGAVGRMMLMMRLWPMPTPAAWHGVQTPGTQHHSSKTVNL